MPRQRRMTVPLDDACTWRPHSTRSTGPASCARSDESRQDWPGTVTCAARTTASSCSGRRKVPSKKESSAGRPLLKSLCPSLMASTGISQKDGRRRKPSTAPWDVAFHLDDGAVCGSHEATQAFPQRLHSDHQLKRTECEYIPSKLLSLDIHPPEARAGWKVRHDKCFALLAFAFGSLTSSCTTSRTSWTGQREDSRPQLVRVQSTATALVLRFCLGWCQISYHARAMHPDSLHICAQKMQTSLKKSSGEWHPTNTTLVQHVWRTHRHTGTSAEEAIGGDRISLELPGPEGRSLVCGRAQLSSL